MTSTFANTTFANTTLPITTLPILLAVLSIALSTAIFLYGLSFIYGATGSTSYVEIQKKLLDAGVKIYASSGVTDGKGHFGYVIYFREGDYLAAAKALAG